MCPAERKNWSSPSPLRRHISGVTFISLKNSWVRTSVALSDPPGWPEAAAVTMRTISLRTCEAIWGSVYVMGEDCLGMCLTKVRNNSYLRDSRSYSLYEKNPADPDGLFEPDGGPGPAGAAAGTSGARAARPPSSSIRTGSSTRPAPKHWWHPWTCRPCWM